MVGQPRSTQRLKPPVPTDDELALRAFLRDFSRRRPRWGWRRAAVAAKQAGWRANHKRIHRLWIAEGLRVPYRKRKKPLRGIGQPVGAMCPIRPNVVWAMDFQFDQTRDGRTLKILNVVDEFTREALATDVARSIDADGVVATPRAPGQGPRGTGLRPLRPRARVHRLRRGRLVPVQRHRHRVHRSRIPWQNGWIESFNGRMRDEHLNGQLFDSLLEAQVLTEDWRIDYNKNRPHSAHGWLTPVEFVEAWLHRQQQPQLA